MATQPVLGLVVNPIAGIGGAAGLKGSDNIDVAAALAHGGRSLSQQRAVAALAELPENAAVMTVAGPLGGDAVAQAGLHAELLPLEVAEPTTGADTSAVVHALVAHGASLILFAGGDGTARDVVSGLGDSEVAVVGIPTGVKMYSSCFAISPVSAGRIAAAWLSGECGTTTECEVLDISEEQVRAGHVQATLFGLVQVPYVAGRTQARKAATASSETGAVRSAAAGVAAQMQPGHTYLLGPGSTVSAVAEHLGVAKTPLGFDAVRDGQLVGSDLDADQMRELAEQGNCHAVITVIGGQGFLLGRGNQQLAPEVLHAMAEPKLLVVATQSKLLGLSGPLLIDTGDVALDSEFARPTRVVTGRNEMAIVDAVAAATDSTNGARR